jgi:hypothetical protein
VSFSAAPSCRREIGTVFVWHFFFILFLYVAWFGEQFFDWFTYTLNEKWAKSQIWKFLELKFHYLQGAIVIQIFFTIELLAS